jgi:hypothetical protein
MTVEELAISGSACGGTDKSQCDASLVRVVDIRNDDHRAALSAFGKLGAEGPFVRVPLSGGYRVWYSCL